MKKLLLLILLIPTLAISEPYKRHKLLLKCTGELKSDYCKNYTMKHMTQFNGCEEHSTKRAIVNIDMGYATRTKEELPEGWPEYPINKIPFYAKFDMSEGFMPDFGQMKMEMEMKNLDEWRKEKRERDIAEGKTISAWSVLYDKYDKTTLKDSENSQKRFMAKWEEVTLRSELEMRDNGKIYGKKNGKKFLETTEYFFEIDRIRGTLKTKDVRKKLSYFDKDKNGELIDVLKENEELRWFENEFIGDCTKVSNEQKF